MAERWGTVQEAAAILSKNAGRQIDPSYVRSLEKHIRSRKRDGRTNEYNLGDCEKYVVAPKRGQRVAQRVRDQRSGRPGGRPRKNAIVTDPRVDQALQSGEVSNAM